MKMSLLLGIRMGRIHRDLVARITIPIIRITRILWIGIRRVLDKTTAYQKSGKRIRRKFVYLLRMLSMRMMKLM